MDNKIKKFIKRKSLLMSQRLRALNFKRKLIKEQKKQMRIEKLIRFADV